MTTDITLETSEGNFAFALALGAVLVVISVAVSASAFGIEVWLRKASSKENRMSSIRARRMALFGMLPLVMHLLRDRWSRRRSC